MWSASARPTPADKLHVTLHFIGTVARARVDDLAAALGVAFDPFELNLARHALWRNGIAALEPESNGAALSALHRAVAARLRALDVPVETRRYRPHVTLARDARGSTAPAATTVTMRVREFVLVESRPDGRYVPLALHPATP